MRVRLPFNFVVGVLGLSPLLALAIEPATQPVIPLAAVTNAAALPPEEGPTTRDSDDTKPHRAETPPTNRSRSTQRPSQKDITDAMAFMKEHSRNRFDAIQSLSDADKKTRVTDVVVRNWLSLKSQDQNLQPVLVQRTEVEDTIFGLVSQMPKEKPEDSKATQALRDAVGKLVDLGLEERQIRLENLEKTLKQQQEKLAEDRGNRGGLVEDRLKTILNDEKNLLPPSGAPQRRTTAQQHN
jgi:hypothetical protein